MDRPLRVLIADDRQVARSGLRALLSLIPEIVVIGEATNGQESLAMVAEQCPDVVLLDVEMPVMDGIEATRRIKSRWPETRVVILTMHATYRKLALLAGADAFLMKGCTADEMRRAISPPARLREPSSEEAQSEGSASMSTAARRTASRDEDYYDRHSS
jgi:DNA-binding NarL/FixJ family response regulator